MKKNYHQWTQDQLQKRYDELFEEIRSTRTVLMKEILKAKEDDIFGVLNLPGIAEEFKKKLRPKMMQQEALTEELVEVGEALSHYPGAKFQC